MTTSATPLRAARARVRRVLGAFALLTAMVATGLVGPSVVSPKLAEPAHAAVYSSCTMTRCTDARTARSGWSAKGLPTTRGWYS